MGESACVGSSWLPGPPPPVYTCTLSPELVAKAREELQEKPEWRLRDAQALRDMILKEQPDLQTRLDDAFLLRFLRARKFDYDRALRLLLNYHAGRTAWPEVFRGLRPSAVKHVLDAGFLTVLPRPDPDGRYILCLRPGRWKAEHYPFVDNVRAVYLTLEKLVQAEATQVNGVVVLADYSGVGVSQASDPGPFLAKKVVAVLQDGFPVRIKAVHVVNEPRIFKGIFALIKPFLKEKMAQRYTLHSSDLRSLHRQIPPSVLPEEYGGAATATADARSWSDLLMDSEEDLAAEFCRPPEEAPEDRRQFRGPRSQLYSCY